MRSHPQPEQSVKRDRPLISCQRIWIYTERAASLVQHLHTSFSSDRT
ncbi:MAG TPA: hypothetical protein V6D43_17590 [Candidatus Sericytochromatia bacterium]